MFNLVAQAKKNETFRNKLVDMNLADIMETCKLSLTEARRLQHAAAVFQLTAK